jgi:branched-chain amino acid transport system ATP-binding protein
VSALLEATGVGMRYGQLTAVDDVSFTLREGEILGLIGPNGAGKTTMVSVLSGALSGWTGDVLFEGRSIRGLRPAQVARLGISRTFQVAQPFVGMSVLENVMVGALYGSASPPSTSEARVQAGSLLDALGLADKAALPAESLNAPERKRLEMARALATNPRVLLLDEVMAGLNAVEIGTAVELIRRVRERGVAIVLIEHVMQAIAELADRVVVLHHGRKLLDDRPDVVFADTQLAEAYLGGRAAAGEGAVPR